MLVCDLLSSKVLPGLGNLPLEIMQLGIAKSAAYSTGKHDNQHDNHPPRHGYPLSFVEYIVYVPFFADFGVWVKSLDITGDLLAFTGAGSGSASLGVISVSSSGRLLRSHVISPLLAAWRCGHDCFGLVLLVTAIWVFW